MNYRSDILHLRPGRKLSGKRLSPHGRSGRRRAASRNQRNWFAAIAGAMTWLRVSSSGGIADAASVSVNAMGRRPGRGRRRSRNSSNTTSDEGPGSKGLGPFAVDCVAASRKKTRPLPTGSPRFPLPSAIAFRAALLGPAGHRRGGLTPLVTLLASAQKRRCRILVFSLGIVRRTLLRRWAGACGLD